MTEWMNEYYIYRLGTSENDKKWGGQAPYVDPKLKKWGVNWPPGPRGSAAPGGLFISSTALPPTALF